MSMATDTSTLSDGTCVESPVQAEPDEEIFDVLDSNGLLVGTAPRALCHAQGLWHRAVVFNPAGQLLIQRRSMEKRVMPGCWDLSAAEHLSSGESFYQGVIRGLKEELGIHLHASCHVQVMQHGTTPDAAAHADLQATQQPAQPAVATGDSSAELVVADAASTQGEGLPGDAFLLRLKGPLTDRHQRRLVLPEISVQDFEFVETWRLDNWQGSVSFNTNEVSEVEWVDLDELARRMQDKPCSFTAWFRDEARLLGLLPQISD